MYANTILFLEGVFFVFLLVCMYPWLDQSLQAHWESALPLSDTLTLSVSLMPQAGLEFTLESRKAWFLLFSCLSFSSHWDYRLVSVALARGIFSSTSILQDDGNPRISIGQNIAVPIASDIQDSIITRKLSICWSFFEPLEGARDQTLACAYWAYGLPWGFTLDLSLFIEFSIERSP